MDLDTIALGNMIYGEVGSLDEDHMIKFGSGALNRLEAGRTEEFGGTLPEVLQKGFYAVSNPNDPYKWATSGKFPSKDEENRYKQALSIAYGLRAGTIDRQEGMFFFTPDEEKKLRKKGKKVFDFGQVKSVGKTDKYNIYSY